MYRLTSYLSSHLKSGQFVFSTFTLLFFCLFYIYIYKIRKGEFVRVYRRKWVREVWRWVHPDESQKCHDFSNFSLFFIGPTLVRSNFLIFLPLCYTFDIFFSISLHRKKVDRFFLHLRIFFLHFHKFWKFVTLNKIYNNSVIPIASFHPHTSSQYAAHSERRASVP